MDITEAILQFFSMYLSVPLLCPSVLLSLGHILWCKDLNLLQGFKPCQSCGAFFTKVHWPSVDTSQVTHQGLAVDGCYVMQAVLCVNCLGDKCLSHAKLISTALTQLLISRFSYLLTNKGIAQCIDNSN